MHDLSVHETNLNWKRKEIKRNFPGGKLMLPDALSFNWIRKETKHRRQWNRSGKYLRDVLQEGLKILIIIAMSFICYAVFSARCSSFIVFINNFIYLFFFPIFSFDSSSCVTQSVLCWVVWNWTLSSQMD